MFLVVFQYDSDGFDIATCDVVVRLSISQIELIVTQTRYVHNLPVRDLQCQVVVSTELSRLLTLDFQRTETYGDKHLLCLLLLLGSKFIDVSGLTNNLFRVPDLIFFLFMLTYE